MSTDRVHSPAPPPPPAPPVDNSLDATLVELSHPDDPSEPLDSRRLHHQGHQTDTWFEQMQVEERILLIRQSLTPTATPILLRDRHISWLARNLRRIPSGFEAFDCLQPWLAFWIVHSLNLLNAPVPDEDASALVRHLRTFRDEGRGGYGGGPRQMGHLASTFSTVMALCSLGTPDALASIDVPAIARFLHSVKQSDGSFRVSDGGEADARAMYCALSIASVLRLVPAPSSHTDVPASSGTTGEEEEGGNEGKENVLLRGVASFVRSLQAFDGGLGGEPGAEAHGGNTYCAVASLAIAQRLDAVDRKALLDWAVMRQMPFEGGFQGRTNKLVDSCYSFWVGSLFPMLASAHNKHAGKTGISTAAAAEAMAVSQMFDADALQRYILECCQVGNGGLRDKPGTGRDLMHTCYALSGLSVAQHFGNAEVTDGNEVRRIDVVHNLREDRLATAWQFFGRQR